MKLLALAIKDWRSFFSSPTAWIILLVLSLIFGFVFTNSLFNYQVESVRYLQQSQLPNLPEQYRLSPPNAYWMFGGMQMFLGIILLFMMPMITMRLFAEEKKQGTMELLLTLPFRSVELVMGKFLSGLGLLFLLLLLSSLFAGILIWVSKPTPSVLPFLNGYLGLLLLGGSYLAIGMFVSSCTSSQVVAGIISFGVALFFYILHGIAQQASPAIQPFLFSVSIIDHLSSFIEGIFETKDLIYFLSIIVLGLFLTHRSLQTQSGRT